MSSTSLVFDILAKDRASSTFDRVGGASGRAGGHLSNLGTKLKSVAKYAALAAAAGAVLAARWGVQAVKAAAQDEQAQKLLASSLQRNTGATKDQISAVEAWIAKQGVALGVTDDELRPAFQRLAEATGSVSDAQRLSGLAMDVAAGKGKSTKQVAEALAKAYQGNIGALGRLGVKTKDAEGNTLTFDQAVKGLADTFGGQAATKADTYQGKMDRLKLVYDETKETIGAKLLPVLTSLATWFLEDGIPAISKTYGWLKDKLGPVFSWIGGVVDKFRAKSGQASGMLDRFREIVGTVKGALNDAAPFFDLVRGVATEVGKVMVTLLWPAFKKVSGWLLGNGLDGLRAFGKMLGWMGEAGIVMWNSALQPVFKLMATAIGTVLTKLGQMFSALGSIKGAPDWIGKTGEALQRAGEKAKQVADNIDKIDTTKRVDIFVQTHYMGGPGRDDPDLASGGSVRSGGATSGRRSVTSTPRTVASGRMSAGGASVDTIAAAMRAALDGLTVTINGDGTATFLLTGASYK